MFRAFSLSLLRSGPRHLQKFGLPRYQGLLAEPSAEEVNFHTKYSTRVGARPPGTNDFAKRKSRVPAMKFQLGFSSTAEGQPRLQLVFGEFLKPLYELVGEWQLAAGIEHKRPECRLGRRASVLSASIHCGDVMITESRRIDLLRESAHFNPKTRFCGKRYPATTIFNYWMDRQARFCTPELLDSDPTT